MTTTTWSSPGSISGDAAFRSFGSGISTALAAIGLVQTSDTGQVNWTTVTRPVSNSTVAGYEIWRFNDALQGTYPLFLKVEYGSLTSITLGQVWLTIGKGSNGSGTLTGIIFARQQTSQHFYQTVVEDCYASSGPGGISLRFSPINTQVGFHIERSLNASGVATGDGVMVAFGNQSTTITASWYAFLYANPSVYVKGFSPLILPLSVQPNNFGSTCNLGRDVGVVGLALGIPIICPGVPTWTSRQVVAIAVGDIPTAKTFSATPSVATNTYRGFLDVSYQSFVGPIVGQPSSGSAYSCAMWWE